MMTPPRFRLRDLLLALSQAVDMVLPELALHHEQVASLAWRIAARMGLDDDTCREVYTAGLVHDIGALTRRDRYEILENEMPTPDSHAFRGARLLAEYAPFSRIAQMVRFHHVKWQDGEGMTYRGLSVPRESHILHLADRACILLKKSANVLVQMPKILHQLDEWGSGWFMPEALDALRSLASREHIWLELISPPKKPPIADHVLGVDMNLTLEDAIALSHLFSRVIDFRSRFTATHSAGVAAAAHRLGQLMGLSDNECSLLLVAGYLHDIGKLSISESILEKPMSLTPEEYDIIRSHTFYTYRILESIEGFESVKLWAALHHERMDGRGYPFHLAAAELSIGSRIMAVADVFIALFESRPYRAGMDTARVHRILQDMVQSGALCACVVDTLLTHYDYISAECGTAQKTAEASFSAFYMPEEAIR